MDTAAIYNQLQSDPDFAALSYTEQVQVRDQLLRQGVQEDPTFSGLSADELTNVYKQLVYAPPSFKDPTIKGFVDQMTAARDSGAPGAQDNYDKMQSMLGEANGSMGLFIQGLDKVAGAIVPALRGNVDDPYNQLLKQLNHPEAAKAWQWLNARDAVEGPRYSEAAKGVHDVANVVGNIGDFAASLGGSTALAFTKTAAVAPATFFDVMRTAPFVQKGIETATTQAARTMFRTIIPAAMEGAFVAGPAGLGVGKAISALSNDPSTDPFNSFESFALNYGSGVAFNVAGGLLMRELLPALGGALKGTFGRGIGVEKQTLRSQQEIQSGIDTLINAEDVPQSLKAQLGPYQQALLSYRAELDKIGRTRPVDLTDEQKVYFGAQLGTPDAVIGRTSSGEYQVFRAEKGADPTVVHLRQKTLPTLYDVADEVARISNARVQEIQKGLTPSDLMLAQKLKSGAPWLAGWHESNIGASNAFDAAQPKKAAGYIPTADRFYVGTNEVNGNLKGFQAVPVKLPMSADRVGALQNGKGAVTYSDLSPMIPDESGSNGLMFVKNPLDVQVDVYAAQGPGSIFAARVRGYDSLRLIKPDGTTQAYVPLTPSNVKVLISQTDLRGHPVQTVSTKMRPAKTAGIDLRASVQGSVDAKVSPMQLGENAPLMTDFMINRFQGQLRQADVQTAIASLRGIEPNQVRVKIIGTADTLPSGETIRVRTNADGTVDIDVPASMTNKATTARFIRELTTKAGLPTGKPGEKLAPTSYAVLERLKNVKNADLDPMMKIMEGRSGGTKIAGPATLSKMLKETLGVDLISNEDGSYSAMLRGQMIRGTLADIYRTARPDLVPEKAIQDQFDLLGAKVHRNGQGVSVEMPGQSARQFKNLTEAAEQNGLDLNQLPSKYRPVFIELDPGSQQIQVYADTQTIRLGKADAFALFNSFADDAKIDSVKVMKAQSGLAALIEQPQQISVIDLATKTRMSFSTIAEAKEWTTLQRKPYEHIRDMARLRGMNVDYNRGQFELRTGDPEHPLYRSTDVHDFEKVLEAYRTDRMQATEMAPFGDAIMADLPDDLVREWKSLNRAYSPLPMYEAADYATWTPSHRAAMMQGISNTFETFNTSFQKAVAAGHVPPELQTKVNRLTTANEANFGEWFQAERLIGKIFSVGKKGKTEIGSKSKLLEDDRQRLLYSHLTQTGTELELLRKTNPLTAVEETMVRNLRDLTDRLADKFGIPLLRRLPQYMTRVRLAAYEDPKLMESMRNAATAQELLSALERNPRFNDSAIREMKPWFEKSRKQDLMTDVFEDRAMHATLRYLQAGLRKYWLDIPAQDFTNTYNLYKPQMPKVVQNLVENWYGRITNTLDEVNSEVTVRETGREFARGFGERMAKGKDRQHAAVLKKIDEAAKNADLETVRDLSLKAEELKSEAQRLRSPAFAEDGTKLWDKGMQVSYATMLGLKPMLAIRNTMQLYSMYGPAFGFSHLSDAVKTVLKAPEARIAEWADRLMASNDLGPQHPFVSNEQIGGKLGAVIDKTLTWYRNADSYSRLVGYLSATSRFADAVEKLARGVFGSADDPLVRIRFERYSGMDVFAKTNRPMADRVWQEAVAGAQEGGQLNADGLTYTSARTQIASDIFSKEAVHATLFNYAAYNKPMIFSKGVPGQLFGQLGMFPASYRGYIMQMLRNLSPDKIASFGLTFIASNLALLAAFKLAGVRTNDFVPLLPGVMGMGPSMEQAMNIFEATGQGPAAVSAQRDLLAYISFIVPRKEVLDGDSRARPGAPTVPTFNYPTILPGSAQFYYLQKATGYAEEGDWYNAALSALTAQVESQTVDLEIPLPGGKLSIPEAHPQELVRNALDQGLGMRVPFRSQE